MNQRILIIAPRFPVTKNQVIAPWALNQAKALQRNGAEVEVISPTPYVPSCVGKLFNHTRWSELEQMKTFDQVTVRYPRTPVYNTERMREIYNRFPKLEIKLLWSFSKTKVDDLVHSFNPDILFCHHPIPGGFIGLKTYEAYDIPYITVEHSLTDVKRTNKNNKRRKLYRKILRKSATTITVSQMMKNQIQNLISIDIDINVVYNGYDPSEAVQNDDRIETGADSGSFQILSVGSFIERKGHKYLLKALGLLQEHTKLDVHCTLVGNGPLEDELEELVSAYGINERIEFKSKLSRSELNNLMASSDFFALPSWDEPYGVVYPEVMAHGVPALMCENQGFSEFITDGKTGFLVPPRNANAISEIISEVVNSPWKAQKIGHRGQQLVEENLTWDVNAKEVRKVIDQNI